MFKLLLFKRSLVESSAMFIVTRFKRDHFSLQWRSTMIRTYRCC